MRRENAKHILRVCESVSQQSITPRVQRSRRYSEYYCLYCCQRSSAFQTTPCYQSLTDWKSIDL